MFGVALSLSGGSLWAGSGIARAADIRITPGAGVSETYTDNVTLATGEGDRNSDFITTLSPTLEVRGQGKRLNLNLNYAPQYNIHQVATDRDGLQQNLLASGRAELWEKAFFIDTQASINQAIASTTGPDVSSPTGQEVNRTEVRAINVTPSFRHHFGTWVDTESRITQSIISQDSAPISSGTSGTTTLPSQTTKTLSESIHIGSGRRFTTLLWSLDLFSSKTTDDTGLGPKHRNTLDTNYTYVLNRYLSLLGGVGYEKVKDPTLPKPPKGLTWNVGGAWRPSQITSIQATTGDRDNTTATTVHAVHRLSSRTLITADYNESLLNSAQQIAQSLNFLTLDANGVLVDSRTGQPFVPGSTNFGIQQNTFRQQQLQIRVSGTRRRNSFSGGIDWEKRNTEATGIIETISGVDIQFTRQLTHISSGTASVSYRKRDFGTPDGRVDDQVSGSLSYAYQLFKDVDARFTYNLTWRTSTVSEQHLKENSFTLALVKRF